MTQGEFDRVSAELLKTAEGIQNAKRPGYTLGNLDVLHNFKSVGQRVGISTAQAWGVYALKHDDAVMSIMGRPELPISEDPLGRFADRINYTILGWAIYLEGQAKAEQRAGDEGV